MALTEFLTTDRALASVFNDKVVTPTNAYITSNDLEVSEIKRKELNQNRKQRMGGI